MDYKTVRQAWRAFREKVVHPEAGPEQIREMRRAFYAGAWAMHQVVKAIGEDDVTEAEGFARLSDLEDEMRMFGVMESGGGE